MKGVLFMATFIRRHDGWSTFNWPNGMKPIIIEPTLKQEASQNLEAVINRLLLAGREEEAELLFDEFA